MPAFFLFSSVFFFSKERKYKDVVTNKFKTLIVPYLVWNTFWVIVWILLQELPVTAAFSSGFNARVLDLDALGLLNLYGIGALYPLDYPLWFMRDLFFMFLIYPALKLIVSKAPKIALVLGAVILFLPNIYPNMFLNTAAGWFLIGGALVYLNIHLTLFDKVPVWTMTLVYVVSIAVTIYVELWQYKSFIVIFLIFIGIGFLFRLSKVIYDNNTLKDAFLWLSKYTMIIFVFHERTLSCIEKVLLKVLPNTDLFVILIYHLVPFLVIGICIAFGMLLQKIVPKFYVLSTGGR